MKNIKPIWSKIIILAVIGLSLLVIYLLYLSVNSARANTESGAAFSDVRQLASSLELYFNNKKSYPQDLSQLVPDFIGKLPNRQYRDKKSCLSDDVITNYSLLTSDSYSLQFCLPQSAGGFNSGEHTMTQQGIK